MNLQQQVVKQLEQLVANGPQNIEAVIQESPEAGYIVGLRADKDNGVGVSLSLVDYDHYSVALRHLTVYDNSRVINEDDTKDYLHQVAVEITRRLSYLEEPLALLELSDIDGIAQLRSNPPENGPNDSTYWEVSISVSPYPQAKLARYQWTAESRERMPITYPATFATLGRLAEDLAASLTVVVAEAG